MEVAVQDVHIARVVVVVRVVALQLGIDRHVLRLKQLETSAGH